MRNSPARRPDTFARAGHPKALRPVRRLFSSSLPPDVYTGNVSGVAQIKRGTPEGIPLSITRRTLENQLQCKLELPHTGSRSRRSVVLDVGDLPISRTVNAR